MSGRTTQIPLTKNDSWIYWIKCFAILIIFHRESLRNKKIQNYQLCMCVTAILANSMIRLIACVRLRNTTKVIVSFLEWHAMDLRLTLWSGIPMLLCSINANNLFILFQPRQAQYYMGHVCHSTCKCEMFTDSRDRKYR